MSLVIVATPVVTSKQLTTVQNIFHFITKR